MTKALVPHSAVYDATLSTEHINENLQAIAADIQASLDCRYTYCAVTIDLTGIVDTDTAAQRSITFARPTSTSPVEIVDVTLRVYSASGVTWTLACTAANWASIALATAGSTTEATAFSAENIAVGTGGVVFTLSASAGSTLTRAELVLTLRCDRGAQGASPNHAGYTPTPYGFVDAASYASALDAELVAAAAAVARDLANASDLRCECFVGTRNSAALQTWEIPNGSGRTALAVNAYIVATAADAVTVAVTGASIALVGTGTANTVSGTGTQSSPGGIDPTDAANDTAVTFTTTVGTPELVYCFVWWR